MSGYPRNALLDEPLFRLSDAAQAAGIDASLLRSWLHREPVIVALGEYDQPAQGTGRRVLLTLRRVISIAIAVEFVELGVITSRAGRAAFLITDEALPGLDVVNPLFVIYPGPDPRIEVVPPGPLDRSNQGIGPKQPAAAFLAVNYSEVRRKVTMRLLKNSRWRHLPIG
jgi:hypothetical protein